MKPGSVTSADHGRKVVYRPPHVPTTEAGEEGVITGLTSHPEIVFVRYGSDVFSKATYVIDLEFA